MLDDIRGAEDQQVDVSTYWELFGASFLPIPSVADAVVVVVGS